MNEDLRVRVSEELKEKLRLRAKQEYTTMSGLIKRILKEYLERGN